MKFILFASIFSFAVAAAVAPSEYSNNPRPYEGNLPQRQAENIAKGFISVLQNKTYNDQPPSKNYKTYVEPKYIEYSGSINSLISKTNDVSPMLNPPPLSLSRTAQAMLTASIPSGQCSRGHEPRRLVQRRQSQPDLKHQEQRDLRCRPPHHLVLPFRPGGQRPIRRQRLRSAPPLQGQEGARGRYRVQQHCLGRRHQADPSVLSGVCEAHGLMLIDLVEYRGLVEWLRCG